MSSPTSTVSSRQSLSFFYDVCICIDAIEGLRAASVATNELQFSAEIVSSQQRGGATQVASYIFKLTPGNAKYPFEPCLVLRLGSQKLEQAALTGSFSGTKPGSFKSRQFRLILKDFSADKILWQKWFELSSYVDAPQVTPQSSPAAAGDDGYEDDEPTPARIRTYCESILLYNAWMNYPYAKCLVCIKTVQLSDQQVESGVSPLSSAEAVSDRTVGTPSTSPTTARNRLSYSNLSPIAQSRSRSGSSAAEVPTVASTDEQYSKAPVVYKPSAIKIVRKSTIQAGASATAAAAAKPIIRKSTMTSQDQKPAPSEDDADGYDDNDEGYAEEDKSATSTVLNATADEVSALKSYMESLKAEWYGAKDALAAKDALIEYLRSYLEEKNSLSASLYKSLDDAVSKLNEATSREQLADESAKSRQYKLDDTEQMLTRTQESLTYSYYEIASLKESLSRTASEVGYLYNEKQSLENLLRSAKDEASTKSADVQSCKQYLYESYSLVEQLNSRVSYFEYSNTVLENSKHDLESIVASLRVEVDSKSADAADKQNTIERELAGIRSQLIDRQYELEASKSEAKQLDERLQSLTAELASTTRSREEALASLQISYSTLNTKDAELIYNKVAIAELYKDLAARAAEVLGKDEQIQHDAKQLETLQQYIADHQRREYELSQQMQDLSSNFVVLRGYIEQKDAALLSLQQRRIQDAAAFEAKNADLAEQVDTLSKYLEASQYSHASLLTEKNNLVEEMKERDQQHAAKMEELHSYREEDAAATAAEIASRETKITELVSSIEYLYTYNKAMEEKLAGLNTQLEVLQTKAAESNATTYQEALLASEREAKIYELYEYLRAAHATEEDLMSEKAALESSVADAKQLLQIAEHSRLKLEMDHYSCAAYIAALEVELQKSLQEHQHTSYLVGTLREELSEKTALVATKDAGLATLKQEMTQWASDLKNSSLYYESLSSQLSAKDAYIASLKSELESMRGNLGDQDGVVKTLNETIQSKNAEINSLHEYLATSETELVKLKQECSDYHSYVIDKYAELDKLAANMRDKEALLESLGKQLEGKTEELSKLETDVSQKTSVIVELESQLKSKYTSVSALDEEIVSLRAYLAATYTDLEYLKKVTAEYEQLLSTSMSEIDVMRTELAKKDELLNSKTTEIASLQAMLYSISDKDEHLTALSNQINDLRYDIAAKESHIETLVELVAEKDIIEATACKHEATIRLREVELATLREEASTLEQYLADLKKYLSSTAEGASIANTELVELRERIAEKDVLMADLLQQVAEKDLYLYAKEDHISTLLRETDGKDGETYKLFQYLSTTASELADAKTIGEALRTELAAARTSLEYARASSQELKASLDDNRYQVETLYRELAEKSAELESVQEAADKLLSDHVDQKHSAEELKDKLDASESARDVISEEYKSLYETAAAMEAEIRDVRASRETARLGFESKLQEAEHYVQTLQAQIEQLKKSMLSSIEFKPMATEESIPKEVVSHIGSDERSNLSVASEEPVPPTNSSAQAATDSQDRDLELLMVMKEREYLAVDYEHLHEELDSLKRILLHVQQERDQLLQRMNKAADSTTSEGQTLGSSYFAKVKTERWTPEIASRNLIDSLQTVVLAIQHHFDMETAVRACSPQEVGLADKNEKLLALVSGPLLTTLHMIFADGIKGTAAWIFSAPTPFDAFVYIASSKASPQAASAEHKLLNDLIRNTNKTMAAMSAGKNLNEPESKFKLLLIAAMGSSGNLNYLIAYVLSHTALAAFYKPRALILVPQLLGAVEATCPAKV